MYPGCLLCHQGTPANTGHGFLQQEQSSTLYFNIKVTVEPLRHSADLHYSDYSGRLTLEEVKAPLMVWVRSGSETHFVI